MHSRTRLVYFYFLRVELLLKTWSQGRRHIVRLPWQRYICRSKYGCFCLSPKVTYLHTKIEEGLKFFISNFASLSWRIALNVLKPDNDDQAGNKKYVDDSVKKIPSPDLTGYLLLIGSRAMTGNLDMGNKQITNLGADIKNTYDVVNLGFCDTKYQQKVSNSDLDMDQHRIKDMGPPVNNTDAVNKYYVDLNFLNRLNPAAMGGDLDMRGHEIKFLKLSTDPSAAARVSELNLKADKNYVDNRDTYVINTVVTSVNTTFNTTLRRDGSNSMTADLNLDDPKLINVKEPTNDRDGVNKKYFEDKLAESHLISSHKTNEFKYLYDTDESASENNIRVNGFENNFRESAHQNKKAYSITMIKDTDGSNDYRSGISFNIYPLLIGTFTMIFEYYWSESTNVSLSTQGTTVYIHKQVYRAFDTYGKLLVQINNNSKTIPDRITLVIHGRAAVQNPEGYLVIYGIKGWSDSVDPRVYDGLKNEMFDFENNKMKMQVDIDMDNNTITGLKDPTNDQEAVTKRYLINAITTNLIQYFGTIDSSKVFTINGLPFTRSDVMQIQKIKIITQGSKTGNDSLFIRYTKQGPRNDRYNFAYKPNENVIINIDSDYPNIEKIELRNGNNMKFEIIFDVHHFIH